MVILVQRIVSDRLMACRRVGGWERGRVEVMIHLTSTAHPINLPPYHCGWGILLPGFHRQPQNP